MANRTFNYNAAPVDTPLHPLHRNQLIDGSDNRHYEHEEYATQDLVQQRIVIMFAAIIVIMPMMAVLLSRLGGGTNSGSRPVALAEAAPIAVDVPEDSVNPVPGVGGGGYSGQISPVFTREVRHWEAKIITWSAQYDLDPNLAAIVMQVESCGDPNAVSSAGAQGLFQVMPFHFTSGENMQDPDTNARRGLNYLTEGLRITGGNVGLSFAGYNGGHGTAAKPQNSWPNETQRYYTWTTGIYADIQAGMTESPTIQSWLQAGGSALCQQAANRLGLNG